jgi:Tol biopolymer transport system component
MKWLIGISLLLLVTSIIYSVFRDRDPYKYYTGLGSELAISPNDEKLAFSYFLDGFEAIYMADPDGENVTKISKENEGRFHTPRFSSDGKRLLFLSADHEGIQTLMIMNVDCSKSKQISDNDLHIIDAVFAPTGEMIYYIAMPAEDYKKAEGETKEGYDLYMIDRNGEEGQQLTNKDHFTMNDLSISKDGAKVYYSLFDGNIEQIYSYHIEENKEAKVKESHGIKGDMYASMFSPDKQFLVYTAVTKESKNSSLFEYELFSKNLETNETKRLTNLKANIQSPVFFHHTNKLAFLVYKNWPNDPAEYQLMTVSINGGEPEFIDLNLPASEKSHWLMKTFDFLLNEKAIAVYYVLLLGSITASLQRRSGRVFLPALISLGLAVFAFIGSFVIAAIMNPWAGIAVGMVAITLFLCSLLLNLFAFIIKRFVKPI